MTPRTLVYLHSLGVAIGTGVSSFLMGTFANGFPTTKAAWHGLVIGCAGAAVSRIFGWILGRIQETPQPGKP